MTGTASRSAPDDAAIRRAVEIAAFSRSVADSISSGAVTDRITLGIYYSARLSLEHSDALIVTGFDENGRIMREEVFVTKPILDAKEAERRLAPMLRGVVCPYYAAARKDKSYGESPDKEKDDESNAVFKVFWDRGKVLEEYVSVNNYDFSLLSRRYGKRFPEREGFTLVMNRAKEIE